MMTSEIPEDVKRWRRSRSLKYRVHRLEVSKDTAQEKLERFLNQLEGRDLARIPYVVPSFQGTGATSRVDFLLVVEEVA